MTVTIGRRELLAALGGAAAAWPLAARAQQAEGAARIGVLSPLSASETTSAPFEAFRKALRHCGYIEGKSWEWQCHNPTTHGPSLPRAGSQLGSNDHARFRAANYMDPYRQ
jgi:hypothetical protein